MTFRPTIQDRIDTWIMSMTPVSVEGGTEEPVGKVIQEVNDHVTHMADRLYSEYEPTRGPHPDFWQRIEKWLNNLEEESRQQYLFRLLPHVFFVGPREFESLYRGAFNHQVATWLIDQLGISLNELNAGGLLKEAAKETWFCPITDSMRINSFYHLNHIEGRDYRPDWRSLYKFGSIDKLSSYISQSGIKRIVLLEDFVGNGSQIKKSVEWAASQLPGKIPLLIVPLLLCPCGLPFVEEIQQKYPHVRVSPCILLPDSTFIEETASDGESPVFTEIRQICTQAAEQMKEGLDAEQLRRVDRYIPFGWDKTGALIVLYTNCPNNTLPIMFHGSPRWKPLFPRSARV